MLALSRTQPFYGLKFEGRSFDCGSKIGFLTANVAYALERKDIAPEFREELRRMLGTSRRAFRAKDDRARVNALTFQFASNSTQFRITAT